MEISRQLHAQAVLLPGKSPLYPLNRRLGGPHFRFCRLWSREWFIACTANLIPDRPTLSRVITMGKCPSSQQQQQQQQRCCYYYYYYHYYYYVDQRENLHTCSVKKSVLFTLFIYLYACLYHPEPHLQIIIIIIIINLFGYGGEVQSSASSTCRYQIFTTRSTNLKVC
jgi:hypothetical protein